MLTLVVFGALLCPLGRLGNVKMSAVVLGRFFALQSVRHFRTCLHSWALLVEHGSAKGLWLTHHALCCPLGALDLGALDLAALDLGGLELGALFLLGLDLGPLDLEVLDLGGTHTQARSLGWTPGTLPMHNYSATIRPLNTLLVSWPWGFGPCSF